MCAKKAGIDPDIFLFLDWRDFVRAWLDANPEKSQTTLARDVGCSRALVSNLLNGRSDGYGGTLSDEYRPRFAAVLGLNLAEQEHFKRLVDYDRATGAEKDRQRRRIDALREFRLAYRLAPSAYDVLGSWLNVVILTLAETPDFRTDARWIREQLLEDVPVAEVQAAVSKLLSLGLLTYDEAGRVRPTTRHVVVDDASRSEPVDLQRARRAAQIGLLLEMLDRAKPALTRFKATERYFNASTVMVTEDQLDRLFTMFNDWQAELMKNARGAENERARVYRMNLQFFPLTHWVDEYREEESR
ncbi:MAG: DUF4423 domain-containing protein [Alphaproteobacteria bacterium]|nr:DUF4423 domain-containing protein [Alphaproteobacteria bacterium]